MYIINVFITPNISYVNNALLTKANNFVSLEWCFIMVSYKQHVNMFSPFVTDIAVNALATVEIGVLR